MRLLWTSMGFPRVLVVIAAAAFAAGWGCGGGSSAGGTLCEQGCNKLAACGGDGAACKSQCALADAITASCPNKAELETHARSCLAMDCAGFNACIADKPECNIDLGGSGGSGAGTGGGTGSGGAPTGTASGGASGSDTGGSSGTGTASCDICGKADTCCRQLATSIGQSPSSCKYSTNCQAMTGTDRDTYVMTCSDSVMLASGLGLPGCE